MVNRSQFNLYFNSSNPCRATAAEVTNDFTQGINPCKHQMVSFKAEICDLARENVY